MNLVIGRRSLFSFRCFPIEQKHYKTPSRNYKTFGWMKAKRFIVVFAPKW